MKRIAVLLLALRIVLASAGAQITEAPNVPMGYMVFAPKPHTDVVKGSGPWSRYRWQVYPVVIENFDHTKKEVRLRAAHWSAHAIHSFQCGIQHRRSRGCSDA